MQELRFVNTTTLLPVGTEFKDFHRQHTYHLLVDTAIENGHGGLTRPPLDVLFVDRTEIDQDIVRERAEQAAIDNGARPHELYELRRRADRRERPAHAEAADWGGERSPPMDVLGLYLPHDLRRHQRTIKVCPEKVLQASVTLIRNGRVAADLPLRDLYWLLLSAVVTHEVAHALMDSGHDGCDPDESNGWLYKQALEADDYARFERELADHDPYRHYCCRRPWRRHNRRRITPTVRQRLHLIEESLANAMVLKQKYSDEQRQILTDFMLQQPPGYRHATLWTGTFEDVFFSATQWGEFKSGPLERAISHALNLPGNMLEAISQMLLDGESIIQVHFVQNFFERCRQQLPVWQAALEQDRSDTELDKFLNGTLGVYMDLWKREDYGFSLQERFKLLAQCAANGSEEAADTWLSAQSRMYADMGELRRALLLQIKRQPGSVNQQWNSRRIKDDLEKLLQSAPDLPVRLTRLAQTRISELEQMAQ
ncbi:MAG: hypothetical protein RI907_337 [Pseudomonadota bacterium]